MRIRYVREPEPLGTVGGVRLADAAFDAPFLVINGDLLTKVNFEHLLEFHRAHGWAITMGVNEYAVRIPYGIVHLSNGQAVAFEEKPLEKHLINAGIYVLEPWVRELIPEGRYFDMTDFIKAVGERGGLVGGFPIHEYWLDIGAHGDYERSPSEYEQYFRDRVPT